MDATRPDEPTDELTHDEARERAAIARDVNDPYSFRYFLSITCLILGLFSTMFLVPSVIGAFADPPQDAAQWLWLVAWTASFAVALTYCVAGYRYRYVRAWHIRYTSTAALAFAAAVGLLLSSGLVG